MRRLALASRSRALAGAALLLTASPLAAQPRPADSATGPTLVVMISVDQLRGDYYDRFRADLTGGLRRLYEGGAVFTNAHQDHAITETAPGHASLLSGRFPRGTGITMNTVGVQDDQAPVLSRNLAGASPFRFRGTTLIDWMRTRDPRSRALSVSRKDRGAILPLGRAKQPAYWYAPDGGFTTSTYYADTLPDWVKAFNARRDAARYAGTVWEPLLPAERYTEPDSVAVESGGRDFVFPHAVPADTAEATRVLAEYPFMDELIADFALEGLRTSKLGLGPQVDLLAVSFSTTDAVGHRYGPDSRELHDQIVRLDRTLDRFLDSLFVLRDSSRVVIALSADHGVGPLPEVRSRDPNQGGQRVDLRPLFAAFDSTLRARGLPPRSFVRDDDLVRVDRAAFARAGVPVDSVLDAFVAAGRRVPGVLRIDRWDRLAQADTTRDAVARRWLHMLPQDQAPALTITLTPYSVPSASSYFQHGSPHDYDSHVPVLFYGAPFRAGRHAEFARTVDIAPTLAAVLGVPPTERLDGRVLTAALRR